MCAVTLHVFHLAMTLLLQPCEQMAFVLGQFNTGYASLLKAEFTCPCADFVFQRAEIRDGRG